MMPSLSEQELVDCSGDFGNKGCNGGWHGSAFRYAIENKGLNTAAEYPYTATNEICKKSQNRKAPIKNYFRVSPLQSSLEGADELAPVAVAVDASNWSFYTSGVFSNCGSDVNHAVVLVGHTNSHWIIRNSWGTNWGTNGFIYLEKGNTCAVLNYAYGVVM